MQSLIKLSYVLAAVGLLATTSAAPHKHHHHQAENEKRSPDTVQVVDVPGPTILAYELNGVLVPQSEVCEGVAAGTLKWASGAELPPGCSSGAVTTSEPESSVSANKPSLSSESSIKATPTATVSGLEGFQKQAFTSVSVSSSLSATATLSGSEASYSPTINHDSYSSPASTVPSGKGLDEEFKDGEIDCSKFPIEYGPIPVHWMGIGGWSGIQYPTIEGNKVTHIDTAVPGGKNCTPGALCSYACPPGYQKSQWPSAQGTTGQSVGGLMCNQDNKLTLTNPGLSKTLCVEGTGATKIKNELTTNAVVCRTDYPGTEAETVPLNTIAGSTNPLTCPDSKTYFKHDGDPTTAQYYINNQGVPLETACSWSEDGSGAGNWAPSYLGVGQDVYGKTWVSIGSTIQNNPKTYTPLNYTVEITGDDLGGKCRLSKGKYCSGEKYDDCNESGCNVELLSGEATFVLSDNSE